MPTKCSYQYGEAEKFIRVNDDDPDLTPIKIYLPYPPKYELIDGYGKKPEDQKFERSEMPKKPKTIHYNGTQPRSLNDIWDELEKNAHEYRGVIS